MCCGPATKPNLRKFWFYVTTVLISAVEISTPDSDPLKTCENNSTLSSLAWFFRASSWGQWLISLANITKCYSTYPILTHLAPADLKTHTGISCVCSRFHTAPATRILEQMQDMSGTAYNTVLRCCHMCFSFETYKERRYMYWHHMVMKYRPGRLANTSIDRAHTASRLSNFGLSWGPILHFWGPKICEVILIPFSFYQIK